MWRRDGCGESTRIKIYMRKRPATFWRSTFNRVPRDPGFPNFHELLFLFLQPWLGPNVKTAYNNVNYVNDIIYMKHRTFCCIPHIGENEKQSKQITQICCIVTTYNVNALNIKCIYKLYTPKGLNIAH